MASIQSNEDSNYVNKMYQRCFTSKPLPSRLCVAYDENHMHENGKLICLKCKNIFSTLNYIILNNILFSEHDNSEKRCLNSEFIYVIGENEIPSLLISEDTLPAIKALAKQKLKTS